MVYLPPRAGAFRDKIRIERRSTVSDGVGGTVEGWSTTVEGVPASIVETRGGEAVRAERLAGLSPVDITIRYTDGVSTGDRIVNERSGAIYNIKWAGCLDDRDRFLTLACEHGGLVDGS